MDRLTASAGLAQREPDEPVEALVSRADAALYAAKHAGRDRWSWAAVSATTR